MTVKDSLSNKTQDCTLLPSPVIYLIASEAINQHKLSCGSSVLSSTKTAMVLARAKQKYMSYRSYILSSQRFLLKSNSLSLIFHQSINPFQIFLKRRAHLRYQLCGSAVTINSVYTGEGWGGCWVVTFSYHKFLVNLPFHLSGLSSPNHDNNPAQKLPNLLKK